MRRQSAHRTIGKQTTGRQRGDSRLPFDIKERRRLSILLGCMSVVLVIAAIAVGISIYNEGETARQNAQKLLNEYDQAVSLSPSSTPAGSAAPQPEATGTTPTATSIPPGDGYVQPDKPDVDPKDALVSLPGYDVIGKLRIDSISLELPVISHTTTKALKVSICYFQGALPGEKGNMVITGHNYASGAHFGRLDALKKGDSVIFDAPGGKVYRYEVYETQVVKPDDLAALDKYTGDYAMTLVTCASSGNRRLLVRCKLIAD